MRASAIVLVALLAATVFAAPTLIFKNCTDKALCFSGCQEVTLPTDQCIGAGTSASQILTCNPTISVCGDLAYFSDAECQNVLFTDAFVCDQCNQDHNGNFNRALCSRIAMIEYLSLNQCTSGCSSCTNTMNVTRGECIPVNTGSEAWATALSRRDHGLKLTGTIYAKYAGAAVCNSVVLQQWMSNTQCQSTPTQVPVIPENACINGVATRCEWF